MRNRRRLLFSTTASSLCVWELPGVGLKTMNGLYLLIRNLLLSYQVKLIKPIFDALSRQDQGMGNYRATAVALGGDVTPPGCPSVMSHLSADKRLMSQQLRQIRKESLLSSIASCLLGLYL